MDSTADNSSCDLLVVGAGSGGIGAAIAAARMGLSVLLVERSDCLGGNAVRGGVHNWEPGVGGTGIPFEIYTALKKIPDAAAITTFGRHLAAMDPAMSNFPGGESRCDSRQDYLATLQRCGAPHGRWNYEYGREHWHSVVFEPLAYCRVVADLLEQTGRTRVMLNTGFAGVAVESNLIRSVTLSDGRTIRPKWVVDATADVLVASACGAPVVRGQESRAIYREPSAPLSSNTNTNGVTLIYRITRTNDDTVEPLPDGIPAECRHTGGFPVAAFTQYPCGDYNVNMLPTLSGEEFLKLGYAEAYQVAKQRILAHWHDVQMRFAGFRAYRMAWIAPALGVREGPRIVGRYVLTEHDLRRGLSGQDHADIIAIADHALDTHGQPGAAGGELAEPYGIPLRCLLPQGVDNLLVACRGASFSSLAASSCRLSRTMMQLGHAAGVASALAVQTNARASDLSPADIRQALQEQHVQLEWPLSPKLAEHCHGEI